MGSINKFFNKIGRTVLYHKRKGYFTFIGTNMLRIGLFYLLVIIGFILIEKFFLDLYRIFHAIVDKFSDAEVIIVFFISESILGSFPPDFFMLWAGKFNHFVLMLSLLGVLSYIGGVISYQIGTWIATRKKIKTFIERRLQKYISKTITISLIH